jgi:hypothetical protein
VPPKVRKQPLKEKNKMYSGTFTPKNSPVGRKPGNDMKKNASIAKMGDSPAAWQKADKGLAFYGQDNGSSQRASTSKVLVNRYTGTMNDDQGHNQRQMPNRVGNVTGKTANGGTAKSMILGHTGMPVKSPANPDQIQMNQMANRTGNKCA